MILKFFNKENSLDNDTDLLNVACLMIHAAKIDENYTDKEKKIIKETLTKLSNNEDLDKLISEAETKESDSNHIQDFTKNIKAMDKNDKIEISKAENFLNQSKLGAIIYFVGTVRDVNENKTVTGITYDAKESMVIKSFEEIYEEADNKLNIKEKAVFIEHVKGYVGLKEKSIIIGVACKHRDQAFVLSRYIIEEIKKRSPIWKKEHYENEDSEWLKGISLNN